MTDQVTSYVIKVASRCNLNCSYCYMYNLGDQTYLKQPKFMSIDTITALAQRLYSYCKRSDTKFIHIIFHGGEPLLLSKEYYSEFIHILRETCKEIELMFSMQTNGVTLDLDWYNFLNKAGIRIGISLDGPKPYHDEFRLFHNGKGSYDEVSKAIQLGKENELGGILMVINPKIPVNEFYKELKELEVRRLNLLFPDGHYDRLPDGFSAEQFGYDYYTPYADWLISLFNLWKADVNRPVIRLFETLIEMLAGNANRGNQGFGRTKNGVVVIETDGGIEVTDSLRACYEGITRNGYNVHHNEIDDLFTEDIFKIYYNSHDLVAEQCLNCPMLDICGGGFLGNRFANHNGFDNPTIYCKDIIRLVTHLRDDFISSLPAQTIKDLNIETHSYDDIVAGLKKSPEIRIDQEVKNQLTSFNQLIDL
ncbi:radical SAM protein [Mucilaginibacter sp. KACC 22063]|uniref:radical SAM protein n=1 Tax=Mucilaginibacter sp. KACC 22063 TaxID=3025666 RepID=UPI0023673410|nr:radical SAM protein [Mucilaginibacter sp. KACC 22063]WDF57309.1 radical SAM protein [Mucilaginibacter sp. KACC 22063]